jgi:curli biogenesis system outer membrane secretion channel CsgG
MLKKTALGACAVAVALMGLGGCATESSRVIAPTKVEAAAAPYAGRRVPVVVSKVDNRSSFMRGVFTDGPDRQETQYKAQTQTIRGADYLVTGDVTEFGRKEVGDHQLFGLLGRGKEQIAYAKVTLNIINANTQEVVYSVQGSGEYSLSNREIVGFGGTASYDATLNGKVLDLAMRQAANNLVAGFDGGAWGAAK